MSTLSTNAAGEICLTLRGEAENRILTTVRRWPHWQRIELEHDPANNQECIAVTLIADIAYGSTIREILKRSFNLTFPSAGGSSELIVEESAPSRRGRRSKSL